VIRNCRNIARAGMDGSWITDDVEAAYIAMHRKGYAYSAEAWHDGVLAGGLYGIMLGNVFFGESMFSKKNNASKFAFIKWVEMLRQQGITVIDCQVYTSHLESLGAQMIPRAEFINLLSRHIDSDEV